jgi:hypothetical protein
MSTSINSLGQTTNVGVGNVVLITSATTVATATYNVTVAQSGTTFALIGGATRALTINLPNPIGLSGFTCKFVVRATLAAFAVTITSIGAGTMNVCRINNNAVVGASGLSTGFAADTAIGATIELFCDGVNYYAIGRTVSAAGSITTA